MSVTAAESDGQHLARKRRVLRATFAASFILLLAFTYIAVSGMVPFGAAPIVAGGVLMVLASVPVLMLDRTYPKPVVEHHAEQVVEPSIVRPMGERELRLRRHAKRVTVSLAALGAVALFGVPAFLRSNLIVSVPLQVFTACFIGVWSLIAVLCVVLAILGVKVNREAGAGMEEVG